MAYPSGTFLDFIRGLSGYVADEFESLYALFQGYLSRQHKEDGSHGDITGTSIEVSGDATVGGDVAADGELEVATYTASTPEVKIGGPNLGGNSAGAGGVGFGIEIARNHPLSTPYTAIIADTTLGTYREVRWLFRNQASGGTGIQTPLMITYDHANSRFEIHPDATTHAAYPVHLGAIHGSGMRFIGNFQRVNSGQGDTGSIATATPTTIFSAAAAGRYDIAAYIPAFADAANYTAFATVVSDGAVARIVSNDGGLLTITLSGTNVQVTQSSGISGSVTYRYLHIA